MPKQKNEIAKPNRNKHTTKTQFKHEKHTHQTANNKNTIETSNHTKTNKNKNNKTNNNKTKQQLHQNT